MNEPSMMNEDVEVYLRYVQAEHSSRPWSEVKKGAMDNGHSALYFFDKSSGYMAPLNTPLRDLDTGALSLEEFCTEVKRMVEKLLEDNSNETEHDYSQYGKNFLGIWEIFYGIVTLKWPEARMQSKINSESSEAVRTEAIVNELFSVRSWYDAVDTAVQQSEIKKLEGHQVVVCALEANLQQSVTDKCERFMNLMHHKFKRSPDRLAQIQAVLKRHYRRDTGRSSSQVGVSEHVPVNQTFQEIQSSATSARRNGIPANSQVVMAPDTAVATRAASKKRSYEELSNEAATLLPAATSSSPSASTTLAQPATAAVSVGAQSPAATASAVLPVSTAENEEVPLKMRVKILKFLTKYGDAAKTKEAMRQLMTMATRK